MKYTHALFINPYIEKSATDTMMLFPPTGLEYVATSAKAVVERVTLLDLRYEPDFLEADTLNAFIKKQGVDIIGVGIAWDRQHEEICRLLNRLPEGIPVVAGGYTATEKMEFFFNSCPSLDLIVRGEGEETMQDILLGKRTEDIAGISYRYNGAIRHNPNRPLPDVDALPYPDRSLRRSDCMFSVNGVRMKSWRFDTVLTARGCPFNCKFCTFSLNPLGQKRNYAARSVDSVIDEISRIKADIIMFSDDNFFTDPRRAEEICDRLIDRGIKKRFGAQARLDIARNPVLLGKMVRAGFRVLFIGIESPHDRILKQLNKGFTQETVRKAFAVLRKYPLFYAGYFIYGNVGEQEEEMLYIPRFAREIGVDVIACNKLRIEKFSPLKELVQNAPGYHVTKRGEIYSDMYSHKALKRIARRIKFSFYTPVRCMKIIWKGIFVVKIFTLKEAVTFILAAPVMLLSMLAREKRRGRLGDSLRRTFIRNA
jgi:anaerobic magnesium-protoporphyrin IX monomethyl ester cyclase